MGLQRVWWFCFGAMIGAAVVAAGVQFNHQPARTVSILMAGSRPLMAMPGGSCMTALAGLPGATCMRVEYSQ